MQKLRFFIMLLFVQIGFAQTQQIDSLAKSLKLLKGQELFQGTNTLAQAYLEYNPGKALQLVSTVLSDPRFNEYVEEKGRALYIRGKALSIQANYENSLEFFEQAIGIFLREGLKIDLARCYLDKGAVYGYLGKYDEAQSFLNQSEQLYKEIASEEGLAKCFHEKGHLSYLMGDDQKALTLYQKSLDLQTEFDDVKGISNNYFRMALAHLGQQNDQRALELLVQAKELKKQINDFIGLAKVGISLGVMHEERGNAKTAIMYYKESLEANKTVADKRVNSIIYNNLGVAYSDLKKYDSALVYHKESLNILEELGRERGIIQSHMNIGEIHHFEREYPLALFHYRIAHQISRSNQNKPLLAGVSDKLGLAFLQLEQLDSASIYLNEALTIKQARNDYFRMAGTYQKLSLLAEKQKDFKKSLEYHKLFKKIQDSSFQVRTDKELAEVQAKYDTEKQEREIADLQQQNEKRTLWRNIFAIGTLATLGFALLLFQFFMYRNKKNKELLAAEEAQRLQLVELDKMKSRFFSNISHEFRTPLTLILGPISKLRKSVDETLQPTLNVMERNGKRLLKLINQLLDLSKIESGKIELRTAFLDVVPLLKGWVMSFESMAEAKKVQLVTNTEEPSYFLYIDSEKLEEVVVNLLSNAFKYTSKGGKIEVSAAKHKQSDYLCIGVSDTGAGIPEQELLHIFDRFYQASNADVEDVTGTGIGLALVKELTELHKGSIRVESEIGKGTTFKVLLPFGKAHLKEEEMVAIKQVKSTSEPQVDYTANTEKETEYDKESEKRLPLIVLIEDNEDLRAYIKEILKDNYQVLEAVNGEEGLALAKEEIPDLVISDLMMPRMDGLEVCRRLKEEMLTCHIPIVLLTAKSSREDKVEGLKSLADDYLTKPFDTEELLARLNNLIAIRNKLRAKFKASDMLVPKKVNMSSLDTIFMEKVSEQLESEMGNSLFGVVELAYAVGLSRSQLFRKIKAITNLTPNEYIRSFRLLRAMDLLKQKSGTIAEIAYQTGFQNPSYFSKCFQEQFGMAPSAVSKD